MSQITFKITRSRPNGLYQYTKYIDDVKVAKGWTCYLRLESPDDKQPWLDAVSEFNKDNGVMTMGDTIKKYTQTIRDRLKQDKEFDKKMDPVLPSIATLLSVISGANPELNESDEFLETILESMGGVIPTPKAVVEYAWNAEIHNLKVDIDKARSGLISLGASLFINPMLDLCDETVDKCFETVDLVYNEVNRIASDAIYWYNRAREITGNSEEDKVLREKYMEQFKTKLDALAEQYGNEIKDLVFSVLCIDQIKLMLDSIKNFQRTAKSTWRSLVSDLKAATKIDIDKDFSDKSKLLMTLLQNLLTALAALAGAMVATQCAEENCADADKAALADALGTTPDKLEDETARRAQDEAQAIAENTVIYKYAVNRQNGYALYCGPQDGSTGDVITSVHVDGGENCTELCTSDGCNCKVSMCEYTDPLDYNGLINGSQFNAAEKVIIEFDKQLRYDILVRPGSVVLVNDEIASINGSPLRSLMNMSVNDVSTNYIVGEYTMDASISLEDPEHLKETVTKMIEGTIDSCDDSAITAIIYKYKDLANVDTFIREYISYFRHPELAQYTREHVSGNATEISTTEFVEEYEKIADDYYEDYCDRVKKMCKKKNIQKYIDADNLTGLKLDLDKEKKTFYKNILTHYNINPGNMKYCSKGRVRDFMLYDDYLEYITGDRFNYDEDNPYIVRLADALNRFMGIRQRVEMNLDNIDALIEKFNELCDKNIRQYWTYKEIPYYEKLSELFKGDFYLNSDDIIPAEEGDGTVTLYNKVFSYLKQITNFTRQSQETIEYDEDMDINKIIEEQGKVSEDAYVDKKSFEFEKKLKQIAFRFMSLRKIEQSMKATNISDYISDNQLKAVQNLYKVVGERTYDYKEGAIYLPTDALYNKASVLGPYINMFKKITAAEVVEFRAIMKEATDWYDSNSEELESGKILSSLAMVSWPAKGTIYHNCEKTDYYLFEKRYTDVPVQSFEELQALEQSGDASTNDEFNQLAYPDTAARTNKIRYWLKYCAMATLVNAMLPIYWSTGLLLPSGPLKLPIIYVPIYYVGGRVGMLIGLGICGVAIYPMLVFMNIGEIMGSLLVPINMVVDYTIQLLQRFGSMSFKATALSMQPLVEALDQSIQKAEQERDDIDYQKEEVMRAYASPVVEKEYRRVMGDDVTTFEYSYDPYSSGYCGSFEGLMSKAADNIDYDKLLDEIDKVTQKYDPNRLSFEQLLESMKSSKQEYDESYGDYDEFVLTGATDVTLTYELFDKIYKVSNPGQTAPKDVYEAIVVSFNDSLKSLTNPDNYDKVADLAAYLANISVETHFHPVREGSNYGNAQRVMETFTGHFDSFGNQKFSIPGHSSHNAAWYAQHGQDLFNYVYMVDPKTGKAGRGGNTEWGDGYKYRGGGFTQLTFKGAYTKMDRHLQTYYSKNFGLSANPDRINSVEAAAYSQAAYWSTYNTVNLHNVWTKSSNTASEISRINPSVDNMPCTDASKGGYKSFVSDTEKKYIACYKSVAGSYPADNRSTTAKKTYVAKATNFKKFYKMLSEGSNA